MPKCIPCFTSIWNSPYNEFIFRKFHSIKLWSKNNCILSFIRYFYIHEYKYVTCCNTTDNSNLTLWVSILIQLGGRLMRQRTSHKSSHLMMINITHDLTNDQKNKPPLHCERNRIILGSRLTQNLRGGDQNSLLYYPLC